jgi:hypothetical protein
MLPAAPSVRSLIRGDGFLGQTIAPNEMVPADLSTNHPLPPWATFHLPYGLC